MKNLSALSARHDLGEVRGRGLLVALDLKRISRLAGGGENASAFLYIPAFVQALLTHAVDPVLVARERDLAQKLDTKAQRLLPLTARGVRSAERDSGVWDSVSLTAAYLSQ